MSKRCDTDLPDNPRWLSSLFGQKAYIDGNVDHRSAQTVGTQCPTNHMTVSSEQKGCWNGTVAVSVVGHHLYVEVVVVIVVVIYDDTNHTILFGDNTFGQKRTAAPFDEPYIVVELQSIDY